MHQAVSELQASGGSSELTLNTLPPMRRGKVFIVMCSLFLALHYSITSSKNTNKNKTMSLLESEVFDILETLIKITIHEVTKVMDSSRGTSLQTDAAVNESAKLEFTVSDPVFVL